MIGRLFTQTFSLAIGWTLIHFLWQGVLVSGLLAALNRILKNHPANSRYVAACGSLLLMLALPVATLFLLTSSTDHPAILRPGLFATAEHVTASQGTGEMISKWSWSEGLSKIAPWLTGGWLAGVFLLSIRMFGGWIYTRQLKNKFTGAIPDHWQNRFAALCREIRISHPVRILESALIQAPMVVGWFRPVLLIPASALSGLTPQQLETIIFHELAHIRRYDYLVNIVQTAIEILLFYHPAVWWVSRQVRIERENCCDDWAVERCGDGIAYARALTEIEILRQISPQLAMGIDGGSLLERIQRIVGKPAQTKKQSGSWTAGAIVLATLVILLTGARIPLFPDTMPSKSAQESGQSQASEPSLEQGQSIEEEHNEPAAPPTGKFAKTGFISGMASAGYSNLRVDELIAIKDHGVTPEYVREIQAAGFAHPDVDALIRTKDHGVDPEFIRRIHALGYAPLTLDDFIRMKDHGVDPGYIESIRSTGFTHISVDQMIRLRDHDVDAGFIQKAKSSGLKNLSVDQLIRLRDAGIFEDADFGGEGI